MSITFSLIGGPKVLLSSPCFCLDWTEDGKPEEGCCYCHGEGETKDHVPEFSLNFANANALSIIEIMGVDVYGEDFDFHGVFAVDAIPGLRRNILKALNSSRAREAHVREMVQEERAAQMVPQEDGTVQLVLAYTNYVEFGLSDEAIVDRLVRMDQLLSKAQELGLDVSWA